MNRFIPLGVRLVERAIAVYVEYCAWVGAAGVAAELTRPLHA
jgi:hypothetical protein